jgi:PAS domain S-box-containing protein
MDCSLEVIQWRVNFLAERSLALPSGQTQKTIGETGGQNAEIFRLLVESVRDYAVFVLDPNGLVITWNPGAQTIKGYTAEEILGQHFSKFYLPEAVQSGWPARELLLAEKEGRFADEGWRVKKDGSAFWASVTITALRDRDGRLTGFAKVTQDMTERKQWEERVQELNKELRARVAQLDESQRVIELRTLELQRLSAQLLHIQDEERRRIARDLHDELGQQLTGLKMVLDSKKGNEEASHLAETALSMVRNLSYLLHPPLLDEAGLRPALHWYVDGLSKRSNIDISLELNPKMFPRLPKDIEVTVFRVIQECLSNVYRHSGTESARVEIEKQADRVIIRVRDYGKGCPLELASVQSSARLGVGISGMRERIRQFGGDLVVARAEPGTLVEARIPLFG